MRLSATTDNHLNCHVIQLTHYKITCLNLINYQLHFIIGIDSIQKTILITCKAQRMNDKTKDKLPIIIAVLAGIAGSVIWGQIANHRIDVNVSWELFYIIFSSITALCIPLVGSKGLWKWIFSMMLANYLSGYAFVPFWGNSVLSTSYLWCSIQYPAC